MFVESSIALGPTCFEELLVCRMQATRKVSRKLQVRNSEQYVYQVVIIFMNDYILIFDY